MNIKIFKTPEEIAEIVANQLLEGVEKKAELKENFYLAISGGSTPKILFKKLSQAPFSEKVKWSHLHIFWVDERCVSPEDIDSNYGETKKILLDKITIPEENIHRIRGEEKPDVEIYRYSGEIKQYIRFQNSCPSFDWILLGMGPDGHTASLFPGTALINIADGISGIAIHPVSKQNRISLTEQVINNGERVTFLVTGKDKRETLSQIINHGDKVYEFPAARINPSSGNLEWYVDKDAMGQ